MRQKQWEISFTYNESRTNQLFNIINCCSFYKIVWDIINYQFNSLFLIYPANMKKRGQNFFKVKSNIRDKLYVKTQVSSNHWVNICQTCHQEWSFHPNWKHIEIQNTPQFLHSSEASFLPWDLAILSFSARHVKTKQKCKSWLFYEH